MQQGESVSRPANIVDVARLAGVSHQTVSRVMNDHPNVRDTTREKVQRAIEQLGYRPSSAARALVTRRTKSLGLVSTGIPDYGPSSIMLAFNEAAREAGYHMAISALTTDSEAAVRSAVDEFIAQNVEAVVVIATRRTSAEVVSRLQLPVPLVAAGSSVTVGVGNYHTVAIDQRRGAVAAVEYLISLGHTKIAHVSGPEDSMDAIERVVGWRDTLGRHGLVARAPYQGDWTPQSGYQLAAELAEAIREGTYTAIFSGNDQMALGLIHAFSEMGIRVPQDVSVIGFDDLPEAGHFIPPVTTMKQDFGTLGRDMMSLVKGLLSGEDVIDPPLRVPELIVRESTRKLG